MLFESKCGIRCATGGTDWPMRVFWEAFNADGKRIKYGFAHDASRALRDARNQAPDAASVETSPTKEVTP